MTINLTHEQALAVIEAMKWWQDLDNEPQSSPRNQFGQRIIDKLNREINLAKAKTLS